MSFAITDVDNEQDKKTSEPRSSAGVRLRVQPPIERTLSLRVCVCVVVSVFREGTGRAAVGGAASIKR